MFSPRELAQVGELQSCKIEFRERAAALEKETLAALRTLIESHQHALLSHCSSLLIGRLPSTSPLFSVIHSEAWQAAGSQELAQVSQIIQRFTQEAIHRVSHYITAEEERISEKVSAVLRIQAHLRGWATRRRWKEERQRARQRSQCITEIIQTEETYMRGLDSALVPRQILAGAHESFPRRVCSDQTIRALFSNWDSIAQLSHELHQRLQRVVYGLDASIHVAQVFEELAPFFKMYIQYVNHYDQAVELLQRCQQSTAFQEAMEVCHAQPDFQWSGDLASLLITPIQRVPRYVLLLDRLRSLTSRDHATFAKIDRAVANMTRLAEFVNNQKTEADNKRRVREISEAMDHRCEGLVEPHRRFLREGDFKTDSVFFSSRYEPELGALEPVHLFLFNDLLVIASPKKRRPSLWFSEDPTQGAVHYRFRERFRLDEMQVGMLPPQREEMPFSFFIKVGSRCADRFYGPGQDSVRSWIQAIREASIACLSLPAPPPGYECLEKSPEEDIPEESDVRAPPTPSDLRDMMPNVPRTLPPSSFSERMERQLNQCSRKIEEMIQSDLHDVEGTIQTLQDIHSDLSQADNTLREEANRRRSAREICEQVSSTLLEGKSHLKLLYIALMKTGADQSVQSQTKTLVVWLSSLINVWKSLQGNI